MTNANEVMWAVCELEKDSRMLRGLLTDLIGGDVVDNTPPEFAKWKGWCGDWYAALGRDPERGDHFDMALAEARWHVENTGAGVTPVEERVEKPTPSCPTGRWSPVPEGEAAAAEARCLALCWLLAEDAGRPAAQRSATLRRVFDCLKVIDPLVHAEVSRALAERSMAPPPPVRWRTNGTPRA